MYSAYTGFGKASGPNRPPESHVPNFGSFSRPPSDSPSTPPFPTPAPLQSPRAPGTLQRVPSPPLALESSGPAVSSAYQISLGVRRGPEAALSRPLALESYHSAASLPYLSAGVHRGPEAGFSRPLALESTRSAAIPPNSSIGVHGQQFLHTDRPASFSTSLDNRPILPGNYANSVAYQNQSSVLPYLGSYASERDFLTNREGVQVLKRNRSPPLPSGSEVLQEDSHFSGNGSRRFPTPAINLDSEVVATKRTSSPALKRTRSPSSLPSGQLFPENFFSTQDNTEREMEAKAKRLARFKVELSQNVQGSPDFADQLDSANRNEESIEERKKYAGNQSAELTEDISHAHVLSDFDGQEPSTIIIGLCPDMCPESERAERERKGDLDQYERVGGDRNQTSKSLAVKKYTRTAEREASLIRPMPILQETIDYLLNLLDQPYDDRFLGIYNFLWDRMRAIRMDLRMQHIFDYGAILMLEQMIRLHIIAMHELCEHAKGEGFSEGFDAHLNIEQMNKTSVELFQIYDDHRKKGISVATEKEFRGYYALLKLDKHPGYKVEAAELSLDLAKMTPEIRQTPEVLFARDVARSCRTGNFIAFFRLARRASYLQACLMHAHFAKLRTLALASLHSGLQNNHGLPVSHVAKWLGMEEEDIESLLQYHGFSIKVFEEPYMMKEGPFLNRDKDYPTKCSELVYLKRSGRIVEDVLPPTQVISLPAEAVSIPSDERESSVCTSNEEMADLEAFSSSTDSQQRQPVIISPTLTKQSQNDHQAAGASNPPWGLSLSHSSPKSQLAKVGIVAKQNFDDLFRNSLERNMHFHKEAMMPQDVSKTAVKERYLDGKKDYEAEKIGSPRVVINRLEDAEPSDIHKENTCQNDIHKENNISTVLANDHAEETAEAKLKLFLRLWKRRCAKRREFRKQMQVAANAALDSLSLGPPIQQKKEQPSNFGEFDIDHVMRERHKKHAESWSRLNVSDVIAGTLSKRNPDAKCICWKIIVCSQMNNLERVKLEQRSQVALPAAWLLSKLMPSSKNEDDNDLLMSSPGLSIWTKWVPSRDGAYQTCCLSVVKETEFDILDETVSGASAVLFLVSEKVPWKHQRVQLQDLLMSIPSGSCLPLLILSCSNKEETSDSFFVVANELDLHNIDKSRISSFRVVPLILNLQKQYADGFFSDDQLREGLKWLASESPLQPALHNLRTRELVLSHLNSSLEVLERKNDFEVGPSNCISAFNEALDCSLGKINATAIANPIGWPCPEIALLEESSDEHRSAKWYLPKIGWNSLGKFEPLLCALRDSKLPLFTDDISWLARGSYMGKEIKNQRLMLENCLIRYLTQSSKMMRYEEAMKEASIMLQKSARLELHNSSYRIVPNWVMIFCRIFNWRLMNLSNGTFSMAYVLECHIDPPVAGDVDMLRLEGSLTSPYYTSHPSLDEMIEVGCSPLSLGGGQPQPEQLQPLAWMPLHGEVCEAAEDERGIRQDDNLAITTDTSYRLDNTSTEIMVGGEASKEAENLSKLLEQCDIMQNMLDKELSIYF
ncbi:hypothetical protein I3842_02G088700 [Carya illinoinensis]|uniref:PCI domain-containing protein n=1 Tax=Carya illinoinensis TaxID=32201 RepID=A0A922FTY1_CARIL|nr:hypothetical protein I3842_02G088700 [Carya illinoinensis]